MGMNHDRAMRAEIRANLGDAACDEAQKLLAATLRACLEPYLGGTRAMRAVIPTDLLLQVIGALEATPSEATAPQFDRYISEEDGVYVVHVDTEDMPENEHGPIIRIYLNDEPIFENPRYPGPEESHPIPLDPDDGGEPFDEHAQALDDARAQLPNGTELAVKIATLKIQQIAAHAKLESALPPETEGAE